MNKINIILGLLLLLSISVVYAGDISVQLKRTNPGIAQYQPAELIYDVVNMDTENQIEGFILCRSPDDIKISSINGFASGSGAQYISPKFTMDVGPSQKAVSLVIESQYSGDFSTGCTFKYIPFKIVNKIKLYQKMNLEYTDKISDSIYRELRLDKTVPFASAETIGEIYCPKNTDCTKNNLIINSYKMTPNWLFYIIILIMLIIIICLSVMLRKKR